jgi:hypothetical protein
LESQGLLIFLCTSSILGLIFGIFSTIIGLLAWTKVQALEKSTHTVSFTPVNEEIDRANEEALQAWKPTSSTVLSEQQKLFKEDLEEDMPDFFPDDEDNEIRSF